METGGANTTGSQPPEATQVLVGFRWEGDVPWQKWTQFYSKVFSRFSRKGLKLRVVVLVTPTGGMSDQEVQETRTALKELGLSDAVELEK